MKATAPAVALRNVSKIYGGKTTAVEDVSFEIAPGEFVSLLGPSGCGKTTTLRMLAGLEAVTKGDILIGGHRVNDVPIHKRNIGMVFQNLALFPHKTVRENVEYGLQFRKFARQEVRKKTEDALQMVRLPHLADRLPSQLSGGQQQRVAIARAIVIEPALLLMDEPLSALDAGLREEMRGELRRIQQALSIPTLFVTHDQAEALSMSDKVIVMSSGRVEQQGTPHEIFNVPSTQFVARFFGDVNEVDGTLREEAGRQVILDKASQCAFEVPHPNGWTVGTTMKARIRAERLRVHAGPRQADEAGTTWHGGIITGAEYLGVMAKYRVRIGEQEFRVLEPLAGGACHALGANVQVGFPASAWHFERA